MNKSNAKSGEVIAVIGLGYVGLPVAVELAKKWDHVIGFDINETRIKELREGHDRTDEVEDSALAKSTLEFSADREDLRRANVFLVTVPTPIDGNRQPDLTPLRKASEMVGKYMPKGSLIVYESTVYPGVTEEVCGPILAKVSGFTQGVDFKLGYSPERINPGDKEHTLTRIVKVVSGEDAATLDRVSEIYGSIIEAGVHRAPTIKTAEAAKVIENTQRDLNIALMNELAIIFDLLDLRTHDVLDAAATKWNFLRFTPGLVGGHCIGVDPYYLTAKAESLGYHPQVILAGRRINDGMGAFVAQRLIKLLVKNGHRVSDARVGILGLTFKENVPDLRNSRVPDIIEELTEFGITPQIHDPLADVAEAQHEYGVQLTAFSELQNLDAVVMAVSHREYDLETVLSRLSPNGILIDVKSAFDPNAIPESIGYWSL